MRQTIVALLAVAALLAVVVVVNRDPAVVVETVTVEGEVALDAALYTRADLADPAPALLLAHGFGSDRRSLETAAVALARRGYVVMTWSARGFGDSEGVIGLNDPDAEITDVSRLVDWLAGRDEVARDDADDPRVGIAGGSYGGATALLGAAADPRLDVVVAASTWHSLPAALAPNAGEGAGVLKTQWLSLLFTAATGIPDSVEPERLICGRFAAELCDAYGRAVTTGALTDGDLALLGRSDMADPLRSLGAPTLLLHGLDDTLFGLEQSLANAVAIRDAGTPVSLHWVEGSHSGLGGPDSPGWATMTDWLDRWLPVEGDPVAGPVEGPFGWLDAASGRIRTAPLPVGDAGTETVVLTSSGQRLTGDAPGTAGDGTEDGAEAGDDADRPGLLIHPPGGIPAALSTIPGFGSGDGLLTSAAGAFGGGDVPGQHLAFTSDALDRDLTVLGSPDLVLSVEVAQGPATPPPVVLVKLHDVSPGGATRLLHSAVTPVRLPVGGSEVTVALPPVAHRVVAGNRLRVVLATTDQSLDTGLDPAVLTVPSDGGVRLTLPVDPAPVGTTLPVLVRVALPVLLVVLLAAAAAVAIGRHERRLAAEPAALGADDPVISIRGLVKAYADGKVAVDGLDLEVHRGQVFGLLGPNGAGKTTTMRMLLGLIAPTEGEVSLLGHAVRPGHPVYGRVGVLVEGPGFAPYLTGRQNLTSYWLAGGQPLEDANMARALDVADLGPALDRPVRTYSHGMRQRLAIAQALLGDPELLVLDEPTDGLDPEQIRAMRQLLARLGAEGTTILVSSHLLSEVEQMCTHVAVVQRGKLVVSGAVAELRGSTRTIVVRVDDPSTARSALEGLVGPDALDVEADGLVVDLGGTATEDVVAALVAAGVGVRAVTPRGRLEDLFLELTGADGE